MAEDTTVTKLEQRAWTAVLGVAALLGGWWLQNQYQTMMKIAEQHSEYIRYAASIYVQKDNMGLLLNRLDRIEQKIDRLEVIRSEKFQHQQGD